MWCFAKEWDFKKTIKSVVKNYTPLKSQAKKLQKYLEKTCSAEKQYEKICFSINGKEEEASGDDWLSQVENIVQEYA